MQAAWVVGASVVVGGSDGTVFEVVGADVIVGHASVVVGGRVGTSFDVVGAAVVGISIQDVVSGAGVVVGTSLEVVGAAVVGISSHAVVAAAVVVGIVGQSSADDSRLSFPPPFIRYLTFTA